MYSEKKDRTKSKRKLLWVLVPISIYTIFVFSQKWPRSYRKVPDELVGTWRTSDPMYADRSLEIDMVSINFLTGEGTVTVGFIQKVEAVPEGSRTLYTISYVEGSNEEQCSFYYTSEKEKTIYFKNQPSIPWIKDKDT